MTCHTSDSVIQDSKLCKNNQGLTYMQLSQSSFAHCISISIQGTTDRQTRRNQDQILKDMNYQCHEKFTYLLISLTNSSIVAGLQTKMNFSK